LIVSTGAELDSLDEKLTIFGEARLPSASCQPLELS